MTDQELISIVVPVYKVEQYLHRCIDSLVNQDYSNLEIILVDDGSPDLCPSICDDYANHYDNVVAFHKPNGGLSSARNYGVKKAKSNWIIFVDSDDYVEKTYVSDLYSLCQEYHADLAITRIVRENETNKRRLGLKPFDNRQIGNKEAFLEVYSGAKIGWEAYGKIYNKQLLLDNPFPTGLYEDFAIQYKIIEDAKRIAIGNYEENYHYITRQDSILTSTFSEKHLFVFEVCKTIENYIYETYPDFVFLPALLYERSFIQIVKLHKLTFNEKNCLYKQYKGIFRKGLISILKAKIVSRNSKLYAIALAMGIRAFVVGEYLISLFRS